MSAKSAALWKILKKVKSGETEKDRVRNWQAYGDGALYILARMAAEHYGIKPEAFKTELTKSRLGLTGFFWIDELPNGEPTQEIMVEITFVPPNIEFANYRDIVWVLHLQIYTTSLDSQTRVRLIADTFEKSLENVFQLSPYAEKLQQPNFEAWKA